MRALAISDAHFGAWTGDALLRHDFALEALAPLLDDVDELVLLGDLFDFLFSPVEHSFHQADPFFELVRERMQGKRVVWLAGNHDHHIVVRELRTFVELKVATGAMGMDLSDLFLLEHTSFFQRFLDRRLEGVECRIEYPVHRVGDVLLFHGHYLDAHVRNSLPARLLNRSVWTFAGGRPGTALELEDYEGVIVPLTEFLFTIAQMPHGTASQQAFYAHLQSIGRLLALLGNARVDARRIHAWARGLLRGRHRTEPASHMAVVRACDPAMPAKVALEAFGNVVRNLGWHRDTDQIVFAHTHQPLAGVCAPGLDGVRFWNTGSWIYEAPESSRDAYRAYLEGAWPGTAVVIDTDAPEPRLVELLADLNPARGGRGVPPVAAGSPDLVSVAMS